MAAVEPLHGLTLALLHLTCMDVTGRSVPKALAATAQAFYATIAMGATAALVALALGGRSWGISAPPLSRQWRRCARSPCLSRTAFPDRDTAAWR